MNNSILAVHDAPENRKKAYFAMCKVSFLLLFFTFFFQFLSQQLVSLFDVENTIVIRSVAEFFCFAGIERTISYAMVKMLFSSEAFYEVLSIAVSFVTLALPAMLFQKWSHIKDTDCFVIKGRIIKWVVPMFFLCQLFTMMIFRISDTIYTFLVPDYVVAQDAYIGVVASEFNVYEFVIRVLCTCILVPIVEEYVFRGVIFTYLRDYGLSFAIVASSVIFGIVHSSPVQSVYAFTFGLVTAFLVVVTGNIKTSILFHAANNFIIVASGYLIGVVGEGVFTIINAVYIMSSVILGIIGLYRFCGDDGEMKVFREKVKENDSAPENLPGLFHVFAFPLVAYLLYYIFGIVSKVLVSI